MPPPPGGLGAAEEQVYFGPVPQKKMKPFHWDKLAINKEVVKGKGSVWEKHGVDVKALDMALFEEMFSQKEVKKEEVEKKPKKAKIELLDGKRFQNTSIMLHKLPRIPEIQQALLTLDANALTRDNLEAMLQQIPPMEEIKVFKEKENLKPLSEFEPPEQFVSMVIGLPEFEKRVSAWLFSRDYMDNIENVTKPIKRLEDAVRAVRASKSLPLVLGILLHFGNMMNHGTAKGNAAGYLFTTLTKLDAAKDKTGKVSLLQHLVRTVAAQYPDALDLSEELKPILEGVANLTYEEIDKGVNEAGSSLNAFKGKVTKVQEATKGNPLFKDDPFPAKMMEFHAVATKKSEELKKRYEQLKKEFGDLQEWWSAPAKVLKEPKPEAFFQNLVPFTETFKREAAALIKERNKAKRKKGQHSEQSKEMQKLREKVGAGKKADEQLTAMVDMIREGLTSS